MLTTALCQALIIKKEICPDRFMVPGMKKKPIQCPDHCHACCNSTVILDLTAVESLMIYLLNRDVIDLIDEYTNLHDHTEYCPFMIVDKCIINTYKPSACQMYMPFEYEGKPMCFYLAKNEFMLQAGNSTENYMNSNSYDIHEFMMMIQCDIDKYLSRSFFKNIYDGTLWWKNNYQSLPDDTIICLESILSEGYIGLQLKHDFKFKEALLSGHETYADLLENRSKSLGNKKSAAPVTGMAH